MKRAIISAILLTLMFGLFMAPQIGSNAAQAENITQEDIDPVVETYLPSAEGTLHGDSILEFAETTPDDVMFYPDSFFNDTERTLASSGVGTPEQYNDYTHTHDGTGSLDMFGSQDSTGAPTSSYFTLNFTIPTGLYADGWTLSYRYRVNTDGSAHTNNNVSIYDWNTDSWDWYATLYNVNVWTNYTITTKNPDYWGTTQISLRFAQWSATFHTIGGWCQLADVQWYEMHLADSDHYAESFCDVSDLVIYGDDGGGEPSLSSDGDVGSIEATNKGSNNDYDGYSYNISTFGVGDCLEIRYKIDDITIDRIYVRLWAGETIDTGEQLLTLTESTDWTTTKYPLTTTAGYLTVTLKSDIGQGPFKFDIDYLRIGPADEMGFQHDCSTLEGVGTGTDCTRTTNGDTLNITGTGTGDGYFYLSLDTTDTTARIDETYYPFLEIKISEVYNNVGDDSKVGLPRLYAGGGSTYVPVATWFDTAGIIRMNWASVTSDAYSLRFYVDNDDWFTIDYVKFYSIANFSGYAQHASIDTNDYFYVDDGVLHCENDESDAVYMRMNYDPPMDVEYATYNIVNSTVFKDGSSDDLVGYNWIDDGGFLQDTWRAELTQDLTGAPYLKIDTSGSWEIHDLKFWEDSTDPTISTFTNSPVDPNIASEVTIETIASDDVSIYTVEATAVVEPSGSSVGTLTMTLDYTTHSGAGIYSYTFSAEDLLEGRYTFELEVDDVANQAYEYLTFTVGLDTYDCHIVILNNLYEVIPFDTFEVYKNDTRIYHDIIQVTTGNTYDITVKNRFGDTVNSTVFDADYEMVVFVDTYSFKFMNYYNGFLRINVTRAGVTYSEIIMPLEIVEFNLFQETYTFTVDFLNGTTKYSQEIEVTNSTGYVITGDSLTDVFNLVNTVYEMTTSINVTVTTTNNNVITISIDLENVNSTIWDQTINILTNIENSNSTIYDQTITLISQLSNINSTLYAQTVSILSDISNVNTTLYDQTVTLLSNIENVNSTLYTQMVTLLSDISNVNSTLYSQTVTLLSTLENVNSTIYSQTVSILSQITNMNSTIYSQTVTILSNLAELNATIYLVDDPTNLNPLVLGYSLSDDYCDFTIVSTWHNASVGIYDNDVLMVGPTSELLCPIRYTLSGTAGTHNLSVFVDGGNDSFWYNISYSVALDVRIEEWSVEDYIVEITGLSNADINWYIYNEGVYSGESGSESESIGFHFTFAKNTAIGKHNFSVYFNDTIDGSMYRWFNNSYTISAIYGTSNIYTYNTRGDYVDWHEFTFLVNGTQIHSNQFYNRTDHVYLVSIEDVFGEELYSATHSWARTIQITLDVYTFLVANMLDDQFVHFSMSSEGGGMYSKHITPTGHIEFELLSASTFQYSYSTIATDGTAHTNTGSVTVEADTAVIIFSLGLTKILSEIRLVSPGGGVGKAYVEKQFASVNATLGVMWSALWLIGGILIAGLWVVPFISNKRRRSGGSSYSPSPKPKKPKKPSGGMVFRSAADDAKKAQKRLGIRQKDEREFGPRE